MEGEEEEESEESEESEEGEEVVWMHAGSRPLPSRQWWPLTSASSGRACSCCTRAAAVAKAAALARAREAAARLSNAAGGSRAASVCKEKGRVPSQPWPRSGQHTS